MKKIITVIAITILVLSSVIAEQFFINSTMTTMIDKISALNLEIYQTENIDNENLKNMIYDLDKYWTTRENILRITMNHNDLVRIGEQIKKVEVYIEQNDKENCVYEAETLEYYAKSYKKVFEVNFENIM